MTNLSYVQADLADGTIARVLGLIVIDGIPGWTLTLDAEGHRWAYAPQHVAVLTGEIAREV